jgi:CO/xanthine dehydrogenase FAD-binding subunit
LYNFRPALFIRPKSEDELVENLRKYGRKARIVAGGTGIYELSNRGLLSETDVLIDISSLELSYIKKEPDKICIGARTTLSEIQNSNLFSMPPLSAISDACASIQPLQVKNVATVGGALCTALPFFDMPVALFSLNSYVTLGPTMREVKAYDFVRGYFDLDAEEWEYVKEISIKIEENSGSSFLKFSLTSDDWAIANCSTSVKLEDSTISKASIFVGGAFGEKPAEAVQTEEKILGLQYSDTDGIKKVVESYLHTDLRPETDVKASSEYRMELAKALCKRAIIKACRRVLAR